jgi:oligopeptide/dipeptide ABC transporter ATP-binding protein
VTVQAQILHLLRDLQKETGMAVLLITHDLGIVSEMSDDVAVMYAGQFVEMAPTRDLFRDPQHPYTQGLFASLPARNRRGQDLATLEGVVPDPTAWPKACRFAPRCPYRWPTCETLPPKYRPAGSDRPVRCHLYDPETDRPMDRAPGVDATGARSRQLAMARGGEPVAADVQGSPIAAAPEATPVTVAPDGVAERMPLQQAQANRSAEAVVERDVNPPDDSVEKPL